MSRATKTDRVVAKILGALRDEPETEEAVLGWIRSRYLPDQVFEYEDLSRAIVRVRPAVPPLSLSAEIRDAPKQEGGP